MGVVTFEPFARYFWGFAPQFAGVPTIRSLVLFPGAAFTLGEQWRVDFYRENPIVYTVRTHKWFVPLDVLFVKKLGPSASLSLGGAFNVGPEFDAAYSYRIDLRYSFIF